MSANKTEEIVSGLSDYLEANLDTYIAAVVAAAADGLAMPSFQLWHFGWRDPFNQHAYPVMMIIPDRMTEDRADMAIRTTVAVVMAIAHADIDSLTKLQMRYADALDNLIREKHSLGGLVLTCYVDNIDFYPASVSNQNIAVTDMRLTMSLNENRFS